VVAVINETKISILFSHIHFYYYVLLSMHTTTNSLLSITNFFSFKCSHTEPHHAPPNNA
jgi:hypothetical protein